MKELIDMLHAGDYSCVIRGSGGAVRTFSRRGVADLFVMLKSDPGFLKGASVADKVVGKGAAALMVLGGVGGLYADIISAPALALLRDSGVTVSFGSEVQAIRNRDNTGYCPVETLCMNEDSPEKMLPLIEGFMQKILTQNR